MNPRPRWLLPWRGRFRPAVLLLILGAALQSGGCVLHGDFGRLRPELVEDNMHDSVGVAAVARVGGPVSAFRTTDQERELRDRAYQLIVAPEKYGTWDQYWGEFWGESSGGWNEGTKKPRARKVKKPAFDRTAYLLMLHEVYRRSEASAYAQIVTDARNDVDRLQPFFAAAGRVTDMDQRRMQSLVHVANLKPHERANAVARNRENAEIIAWVCQALKDRAASYRYALERLVIAVPSPAAAEADRAVELLKTRIAHYCHGVEGGTVTVRG
jgi:hypothetical protein